MGRPHGQGIHHGMDGHGGESRTFRGPNPVHPLLPVAPDRAETGPGGPGALTVAEVPGDRAFPGAVAGQGEDRAVADLAHRLGLEPAIEVPQGPAGLARSGR